MIEVHDTTVGLRTDGVLIRCDDSAARGLARCLDLALGMGHTRVVVDLGDQRGACAALLSVLHRGGQRLRGEGGQLAVVCRDSGLRRLLDLTLLSEGFAVCATREEADLNAGG